MPWIHRESGSRSDTPSRCILGPMPDFPPFMTQPANRIAAASQLTDDIEGFVFDGADGSQVAFWTAKADRVSVPHAHDFDEYVLVIEGRATVIVGDTEVVLEAGDEHVVAKGTLQSMRVTAGTRTMHVFGGQRAKRAERRPALTLLVIPCSDLARASEFYAALGLDLVREQHGTGPVHYASKLSGVVLELYPAQLAGAPTRIGLRVPNVSAAVAAATKAGGTIRYLATDRPRAVVLDPDDLAIELTE